MQTELVLHPVDDALVERGAVRGIFLRLPVDRGRPPVEHTVARSRSQAVDPGRRRIEQLGGRTELVGQEQPLAQGERELGLRLRRQLRGIDAAQRRLRLGEVVRVASLPEAFEMGARKDQAGLVDGFAGLAGLGRGLDGQLVERLVVELSRVVGAACRLGQGRTGQ